MIRRSTVVLVVAFIVLLIGAILLQNVQQFTASARITPSPTAVYLLAAGPNDALTSVEIDDHQGHTVKFSSDASGAWSVQPPGSMVDAQTAQDSALNLPLVQVQSSLESSVPTLSAIGLDNPKYTIKLGYKSGAEKTLQIGSLTPTQSGYYVSLDGKTAVVIGKSDLDSLLNLTTLVQTPQPTAAPTLTAAPTTLAPSPQATTPGAAGSPTP